MEVALRYTLLTLFTLLILFTLFKTVFTVNTIQLLFTVQTVACMPIYIVEVRALLDLGFVRASEQKVGLD